MEKKKKKQIPINTLLNQLNQLNQLNSELNLQILNPIKPIIQNKNKLVHNTQYKPPYESSWFETENKVSLDTYIKNLFSLSTQYLKSNVHPDTIKGIFVPHSGIKYSGLCSASAYSQLLDRTNPIKRIIILCTNHESSNSFVSTTYTDIASYISNSNSNSISNTNKSLLKIDTNIIEYLKPYLQIDNNRFNFEHSFFNQLPFIEYIISKYNHNHNNHNNHNKCNNVLLLPFLISNNINLLEENTRNNIRHILHTIIDLLKNRDTILICTSDLSHINGNFETKINSYIYQNIRKKDNEILQFLYNGVNGINERNQKIDDILFIQNAPSYGTLAIYFFAKILHNYSGNLEYSSSSSSSSTSSSSKSPTTINNINWENKKKIKELNIINQLIPRVCCYYTSLMRNKININNINNINDFNPLELNTVLDVLNITEESVSYAGIIFTTQPYIEINKISQIYNMFSEYEKIAIKGLIKEQLYKKMNLFNMSKIPSHLITTVNCNVFSYNLGLNLSLSKNNELYASVCKIDNHNDNDEDFIFLNKIKKIAIFLEDNELTESLCKI